MNLIAWATPGFKKELAAGIAATLLLYLAVLTIPVAGFAGGLFTPLPALLFFYRWGSPVGFALPVAASTVAFLLLWSQGLDGVVPPMLGLMVLGVSLASGLRRDWSLEKTVFSAALLAFTAGLLIIWASHSGGGRGSH